MKFGSSRSVIYDAQQTARHRHDAVDELWADATRRDFAEQVWVPLDALVNDVLRAIDQLAVSLNQVRAECEYDPAH